MARALSADPAAAPPKESLLDRARSIWPRHRRVILAAFLLLVLFLGYRTMTEGASAGSLEASLAMAVERDGIRVDPASVLWLGDDEGLLGTRSALFLAQEAEAPADVWYADVRPGRDGAVLDVSFVTNVTRSAGADDGSLLRLGDRVAFVSRASDRVEAVTVLDLRGEPEELTADWSRVQRWQGAISNLQETGRSVGFGRTRYQLVSPATAGTLGIEDDHFVLTIDEGRVVLDPAVSDPIEGAELVEVQPQIEGVPGRITWLVDTVRNLSFVGPAPIEWLENRVLNAVDLWNRTRYATFGGSSGETASEAAAGLGAMADEGELSAETRALLDFAEAEVGFPPADMTPILTDGDPVEGEGHWIPVLDDPFVNAYPGAPPAFAQSFIRPDPERPYAIVYVTLWDSRQVQLRIVSGTREPESATGERGTGTIPRDDYTLRHLVAAFDGGFQAMHGEFGMMEGGSVYLPPKPWAATVAVFDDGRVGMGSWPAPDWRGRYYDERLATRTIPEDMVDMRQNLTSMVEDGVWNPWERWWWGAAPTDAAEQTFTYRSGMCLRDDGFMAFFWGSSLGPDALGQAMIAAGCSRAMHLDMNSGHCGLELFRPYPTTASPHDTPLLPIERRLDEASEFEDAFPHTHGEWRVRARRAVTTMAMHFPRYLAHDPRDFFYLTLRPTLPGPALLDASEGEGHFDTTGLPHAGWPYAFARTRSDDAWVVRIDPRRAVPEPLAEERHVRVLGGLTGVAASGGSSLYAHHLSVGWEYVVGTPGEGDRVLVSGARMPEDGAAAAIGADRDRFLVYAEGTPAAVARALARAGVTDAIVLADDARLALVGDAGGAAPDGTTAREPTGTLDFFAEEGASAEVIFPDTEPAPYSVWGYLQGQRVRYFTSGPPRFVRPTEE